MRRRGRSRRGPNQVTVPAAGRTSCISSRTWSDRHPEVPCRQRTNHSIVRNEGPSSEIRLKMPLQTSLLTHLPQGRILFKPVSGPKSDLLPGFRPKDTPVPDRPACLYIAISRFKPSMLRQNPLQPPRPFAPLPEPALGRAGVCAAESHPSAEDFDTTGILRGIDPCESRYWWMPELYGPTAAAPAKPAQAGRLSQHS